MKRLISGLKVNDTKVEKKKNQKLNMFVYR